MLRARYCLFHRHRCSGSGYIAHQPPEHKLLGRAVLGRDNYGGSAENNTGTQETELGIVSGYSTKVHLTKARQRKSGPNGEVNEELLSGGRLPPRVSVTFGRIQEISL